MSNGRPDPYGAFNFIVELDGVAVGGFSEATGLVSESSVIEYRNGAEDMVVRKLPGLRKYTNVVLKRGFTDNRELWEWRRTVIVGRTERRSGVIILLDEGREPAARFEFREGWPAKWEGPTFDAMNSAVAIETLEIAHEGLTLVD